MEDDSSPDRPRIRNSQACLECRKAKIKCNGKRKDAQNCTRCEAKGLACSWTQSRRGKKPGTKNLATRAREQNEALQRQLENQLRSGTHEQELQSPPDHYRTESSTAARQIGWDRVNSGVMRPPSSSSSEADQSILARRHGSDASNMQSPQSAITPSSTSSHPSSSVPTTISSNGHHATHSHNSSRRTSKYHDGLLIRESTMPPSSTNPLLCLSEAALGKRCTESDSEDELAAEPSEEVAASPAQSISGKKRGSYFGAGDDDLADEEDAQAKSARDIAAMLESAGWSRSCLGHAACERASYFSGASSSANWDTRRCDPIDRGIVTLDEANRLFQLFMDTIHEQFCILDPVIHNVTTIKDSSNFLFSVILAIATSIDRNPRSIQQFQHLRALVDSLVVEILSRNVKSVEVVKGLLIWPMWAHLTPLMAEDRAWLLIGTAARMAKELDLGMREDAPQEDEFARRHARDRSRTWALAAIMERSFSSFSGQRPNTTLDVEWGSLNDWLKSPITLDGDIQVVAFLHLRRIEEIMRSRIFSQNYYEVGSIESIRVSANVLFEAWQEAWCEHPALDKHPLTSTIMRIIGLHIQVLINTHAIRESDRRKAICEASNMRILRICGTSVKSARDQCVSLLTTACQLATEKLQSHAFTLSRIVSAMLGWSGVHLLKNGPIETRGLVVRLGLMLAGDPQDATHARSFARFYGRFILSLSAELVERDRAEKTRRKRQRLRGSSHVSAASPGTAAASPRSEMGREMTRNLTDGSGHFSGPDMKHFATSNPASEAHMSDMALAFETAATAGLSTPGVSGRPGPLLGSAPVSSSVASAPYPSTSSYAPVTSFFPGIPPSPLGNRAGPNHVTAPPTSAALDSVTNSWLGTDDLLDQYMQSILPIFNEFEHSNNSNLNLAAAGIGSGVAMPDIGR